MESIFVFKERKKERMRQTHTQKTKKFVLHALQIHYLPRSKLSILVNNPISVGIVPVNVLPSVIHNKG